MTVAHSGSRLSLSKIPSPLPDGMILLPLDGRVQDTKNEIPILMNTTTVRDDVAKFNSSTAVEESTVNLFTHSSNGIFPVGSGKNFEVLTFTDTEVVYRNVFNGELWNYKGVDVAVLLNKTYTFTLDVYVSSDFNGDYTKMAGIEQTGSMSFAYDMTKKGTWQKFKHTFTATADGNTRILMYPAGNNATATTGYVLYRNAQLEEKDHFTSFIKGSRGIGNLKYDISDLGIRDAGCIACWIYNSDAMVNNLYTGGTKNNQYIIKLGSSSTDWYQDAVTLWIQNITPRKFKFWSASGTTADHLDSLSTVDQYGGVGSWNHFVLQWNKNGLPSGNKKEFYINGVLQSSNATTALASSPLTYLHLGQWNDNGDLVPSTLYEQLAIHPSKGFSAAEIGNWYNSQAPFYDTNDQLFFF